MQRVRLSNCSNATFENISNYIYWRRVTKFGDTVELECSNKEWKFLKDYLNTQGFFFEEDETEGAV